MSDGATAAVVVKGPAVDGLEPQGCLLPASIEGLQEVLHSACADGRAVIATGKGGRLHIGNVPTAYDIALGTGHLDRVVAHEPADMTVTVQAGVHMEDLRATLAEHGQWLPIDGVGPPGTIGGMLAANEFGALRHRYGTARDWLIGLRVVHADGTVSKSGGRVVKNVSGYDLHKVHVGALGTLGVIVEATFKLAPLPKLDQTFAIACPSAVAAASIISECNERGLSLTSAELLSPIAADALCQQSSWTALLRVAGGSAAVTRSARDIDEFALLAGGERSDASTEIWERWRETFAPAALSLRISVLSSRVADAAEALDRRFAGESVSITATAAVGLLRVNFNSLAEGRAAALLDEVISISARRSGAVVVDCAPIGLKRNIDVFGPMRDDFAVMRRLKDAFDPVGILSPGRFVGRI